MPFNSRIVYCVEAMEGKRRLSPAPHPPFRDKTRRHSQEESCSSAQTDDVRIIYGSEQDKSERQGSLPSSRRSGDSEDRRDGGERRHRPPTTAGRDSGSRSSKPLRPDRARAARSPSRTSKGRRRDGNAVANPGPRQKQSEGRPVTMPLLNPTAPVIQRRTLLPLPPQNERLRENSSSSSIAGSSMAAGSQSGPETEQKLRQYILVLEQEKRVQQAAAETGRLKAQFHEK